MLQKWALLPRRVIIVANLTSLFLIFCWKAYSWTSLPSWSLSQSITNTSVSDTNQTQPASSASPTSSQHINSALISLVRNNEVEGMVQSMLELERTWNHQFNYPWIFFNDEPFDDEFKRRTQAATPSPCQYEQIPNDHWEPPEWIDDARFQQSLHDMDAAGVRYGSLASYRKMCRWNSGFFYRHPALAKYRYYWRVEPGVHFYCHINYDVFHYMHSHQKTYGFTINVYDNPISIASLWPETMKFVVAHPNYVSGNNSLAWLTAPEGRPEDFTSTEGYSTCHFWSNFEIGDMEFFRSRVYEEYFDHLDRAGGFFYERWGDAPVHSLALGLFEDASKIHWFSDIGYEHAPFAYCPPQCAGCNLGFTTAPGLEQVNCMPNWLKYTGMAAKSGAIM